MQHQPQPSFPHKEPSGLLVLACALGVLRSGADLNDLLPANTGWALNEARDINENGVIVGTGTIKGQTHAFVLSEAGPAIPTVSEWSFVVMALIVLASGPAVLVRRRMTPMSYPMCVRNTRTCGQQFRRVAAGSRASWTRMFAGAIAGFFERGRKARDCVAPLGLS